MGSPQALSPPRWGQGFWRTVTGLHRVLAAAFSAGLRSGRRLLQRSELPDRAMGAAAGRTRPATQRLVSVTATARMPTVPK